MQGTLVKSLVQEDPTCRKASKPESQAHVLQLLKPMHLEPQEKPPQ